MDNIINPNKQQIRIDGNLIIKDFFDGVFNRILIEVFKNSIEKEKREELLDKIYQGQFEYFEAFMKELQIHDLSTYMQIKNAIQANFDELKKVVCNENVG